VLVSIFCASAVLNLAVNRLVPRFGHVWAERLRVVVNLATVLASCHLSSWCFPGMAMIILMGAAGGASVAPEAVPTAVASALVSGVAALADGVGPLASVSLVTTFAGTFWLMRAAASVSVGLIEQLEARHEELAVAHADLQSMQASAIKGEKLAGLGLLAAGIAHEINNPMSFVTANVQTVLKELRAVPDLPPQLRECVDDVLPETVDGIRRVNTIVADMRRFARGDPGGSESYDLNEQVERALRLSHHQLEQHCRVVRQLGDLPGLQGRPQEITQVLLNLLVNAAQAIPGDGTVTVTTRQVGDEVSVAVSDTGVGMPPEVRKHLFEPFFSTKGPGRGTGLGLAVSHGIVATHGGRIDVESEPGHGTCFTVVLPVHARPSQLPQPVANG
jgi:signal transduction histidine kinase